jgi:hypothetical protein
VCGAKVALHSIFNLLLLLSSDFCAVLYVVQSVFSEQYKLRTRSVCCSVQLLVTSPSDVPTCSSHPLLPSSHPLLHHSEPVLRLM